MVKTKTKSPKKPTIRRRLTEADSAYFLKLVVIVLLSTLWIKLLTPVSWQGVPFGGFPLGALIAFVGVRLYEKNAVDRKIWFAVIVIVMILSYFVPAGIVI